MVQRIDHPRWQEASALLDRAIALDPFYAQAHAHRAWLHLLLIGEALSTDIPGDTVRARELVDRAMLLDPNDPFVLAVSGHVYSFLLRQPERALGLVHRAIELNEGCAFAWGIGSLTHGYLSDSEAALAHFKRARTLSPLDPFNNFFFVGAAMAELVRERFDEATRWSREALRWNPRFVPTYRHLATSLANWGRIDEARAVAREMLALAPEFRISAFASWYPLRPQASLEIYLRGLRLAGLPE
jgi:tetratricopeptide (TPR) repeat protein